MQEAAQKAETTLIRIGNWRHDMGWYGVWFLLKYETTIAFIQSTAVRSFAKRSTLYDG